MSSQFIQKDGQHLLTPAVIQLSLKPLSGALGPKSLSIWQKMGGHHEAPYKVPHYTTYKVEGCAKLEELENVLARKGLKDPWIRNEVWRYNKGFGSVGQRARRLFFRGFGVGLVLTVLTVAYDKTLGRSSDSHGHGHADAH